MRLDSLVKLEGILLIPSYPKNHLNLRSCGYAPTIYEETSLEIKMLGSQPYVLQTSTK